jgi:NAD(P)-dependent dehydrogenase (short-subunit alcohol dehydrogenase family)
MPVALITGASLGLGRALAIELARRGWSLVVDGRRSQLLDDLVAGLAHGSVTALAGDVTDPAHRAGLAEALQRHGRLDLLVNNASSLGPSPLPHLRDYPVERLAEVFETDVIAPLALIQLLHPLLVASASTIVNISSDAAVEAYEGWGGYGSAKAALDQVSAVLAVEEPALHIYAFDPGDMRTEMHQRAFPGEDISDRPRPGSVVPTLLALVDGRLASGRYRASDLQANREPTSIGTESAEVSR